MGTALDALINAADPATAPVHAVVTTEQQLIQRSASLPHAKSTVSSWVPSGPAAAADYPTVLLAGDWLAAEQVSAASEFARFMRKPERLAELEKAGFRTEGGAAPQSDITTQAQVRPPVSLGDNAARAMLANAVAAPTTSPAVTIMLDQSMPIEEGGKTRLGNVVAALNARLRALPPNSSVGLWTFDGTDGRQEVTAGALSDPVDGQPRSAALAAALDRQYSGPGGAVSFTTLRMVYTDATANFHSHQKNSVLVITAGPHTDQSLDGAGLQDLIEQSFDPAHPIAVNVIDFGDDSDRATWEAVTKATGGSYQKLPSSAAPELSGAIAHFVG